MPKVRRIVAFMTWYEEEQGSIDIQKIPFTSIWPISVMFLMPSRPPHTNGYGNTTTMSNLLEVPYKVRQTKGYRATNGPPMFGEEHMKNSPNHRKAKKVPKDPRVATDILRVFIKNAPRDANRQVASCQKWLDWANECLAKFPKDSFFIEQKEMVEKYLAIAIEHQYKIDELIKEAAEKIRMLKRRFVYV